MVARFDPTAVPSPCFVIDRGILRNNLCVLADIRRRCGIRVLFAQKAFATPALYGQMAAVLDGVCASGLYEARLGRERFGGIVHTYSPAFRDDEIDDIVRLSDHVVFNSEGQLRLFENRVRSLRPAVEIGLRVNPECSVTDTPLYDPCAPGSRLGVTASRMTGISADAIDGLHVHALCEKDSFALEKVLSAFETKFHPFIDAAKWVNLGGGHAFTRGDYDIDHFVSLMAGFRKRHPDVDVFIEPGAAVVWNAGVLVTEVLDTISGHPDIAILDASCACHTPDVLEMPYRPRIRSEVPLAKAAHVYRLGGVSCLAGDVFGDYGFEQPLARGDRLVFEDMAQYSIVKTTMFNGVRHPAIAVFDPQDGTCLVLREFSFDDYLHRQG